MNNLLLVEPDYILGNEYKTGLERAGWNVIIAKSAQSAITAADKVYPDIVILEIQLIEHSGIEFLYEFRSYPEWQQIPVIIQTQVPPSEFFESWDLLKNELGVVSYLYKPHVNLKKLISTANSYIAIKM